MAALTLKTRDSGERRRRVVVTGIGVISPAGNDPVTFWRNVVEGRSGAGPITRFDTSQLPVKIGAEVRDFRLKDFVDGRSNRLDFSIQYGIAAASMALRDAGIEVERTADRVGIVEGTTISGSESVLKMQASLDTSNQDYRKIHPYNVVASYCGEGSSAISMQLGLKGAAITYCSGCASSNDAIGHGKELIERDEFDIMIAGGSEYMMKLLHIGFCRLHAMSELEGDPRTAMRPFDRNRDGFILGEGATFLVLEELTHALSRGAKIYAEVSGHGRTSEAYHPTDPHPEGLGYQQAMDRALRDARIHPEEVDYINAHGSATPKNDPIESFAIKKIFGAHARRLSISATKPVTGHLMGASGAIESLVAILTLHHQVIPPTINLKNPDVGCDLDYVPVARPYPVRVAMNLNAGFGGRYACLLMKRFDG